MAVTISGLSQYNAQKQYIIFWETFLKDYEQPRVQLEKGDHKGIRPHVWAWKARNGKPDKTEAPGRVLTFDMLTVVT